MLEIGCGDGCSLLPFSERGCEVVGVDLAECRINDAKRFFEEAGAKGWFIASDVFEMKDIEHHFDLIICHDVIEHIMDKASFLPKLRKFLRPEEVLFSCLFLLDRCPLAVINRFAEVSSSRICLGFTSCQKMYMRPF